MPTNDSPFIPQAPSGHANGTIFLALLCLNSANSSIETAPGIRNYDYTFKYPRDKLGEEHKENARIWNVYLDEAEIYDADMIQGFRDIIDGLLVFAALFSAIVTTFVAQTSQALQPDNAQITVSLLIETNLLLRAAGNVTTLNAVPHGLSLGATTYTTIDAWVNGLFFSSLSLSLSSALLTVLAKQWIQAYTAVVSGPARTRSLIRHFRFKGIQKWKFETIIQCLPLILHSSVAMFWVGLTLYVSQISSPTCWVVSGILVVTMFFYFATPILSVIYVESPFRVPILMYTTKKGIALALLWLAGLQRFLGLWVSGQTYQRFLSMRDSLQVIEYRAILGHHYHWHFSFTILDSLVWLTDQTTNYSVGEIVAGAATSTLMMIGTSPPDRVDEVDPDFIPKSKMRSFNCFRHFELIYDCLGILEGKIRATDSGHDPNDIATWENLIEIVFEAASDGYPITMNFSPRFVTANHLNDIALCTRILDWTTIVPSSYWELEVLPLYIALNLGAAGAQALSRKFPHCLDVAFRQAIDIGNMKVVIAIVDGHPPIISIRDANNETALEHAVSHSHFDIVDFLLQRGAERTPHLLHKLLRELKFFGALRLLELGWSPFLEDESGTSAFELANQLNDNEDGALHQSDDSVEVREQRTHALGDVLEKMKLMKGE
ncbi:hypothetical protein DXG01_011399 [Tephrocybe rancida]|nr:hypothetical protein DXG01_011399 [Tephrocybe rancida]